MKRLLFFTLAIMMAMTCFSPLCFAKQFPDVESNHWAYKYIDDLSNQGIINGYDDGTYKPSGTVKRSEFLKLVMASCMPKDIDEDDLMSSLDHWAGTYVWFAEQRGVIEDGEYTKENIDQPITRLEMVRLISRADIFLKENMPEFDVPIQDFLDVLDISDEDYDLLCHANNKGLVKGYDDFTFKPDKTMTRAEAATMIWRFNGGKEVAQ